MTTFTTLPLKAELLHGLNQAGFVDMTPIQAASLPDSLAGKDMLAQAKTGSGKTAAFGLVCLQQVDVTEYDPQAVILCPTRELAEQVAEQCRVIGKGIANLKVLTLCGGQPMGPQINSLKHGCQIVVGTPGRVRDHVEKHRLDLSKVRCRVLDEADRMLDMGFEEDLDAIFANVPHQVQTLLFSATFSPQVEAVAKTHLREPVHCKVADEQVKVNIEQLVYKVRDDQRYNALKALISTYQPSCCMVFCQKKVDAQDVFEMLYADGIAAAALHGDMEQEQRTDVLMRFASDTLTVLVATDVAARGLDIPAVPLVINYQVSEEPEVHVHRIGRTGRAGAEGKAITLCSDSEEIKVARIEELMDIAIPRKGAESLRFHANRVPEPEFACITFNAGKKQKIRPGDILGSLTKEAEIDGADIGKIAVQNSRSYVAIKIRSVKRALRQFREGRIKGKKVKAKKLV